MKTLVNMVLLIIVLHWPGMIAAQSKLTDQQKTALQEKFADYKSKLNLNTAQEEKVKAINTTYFQGLAGIKESDGSKLSKLKTYRKLSATRDKEMKEVLDKNQYEIYKKMQQEMKEEMRKKRSQQ
jgi:hypothetical protein